MSVKIIFLDNFDSFVYNLIDNIKLLGFETIIYRNDVSVGTIAATARAIEDEGSHPLIFLSPGPSHPKDANNLLPIIEDNLTKIPMLGVCLGHQALALALGGSVSLCPEILHGQSSLLTHEGKACFKNLPNPLTVGRYHSLYVDRLPQTCEDLARVNDINMAMYSQSDKILSLQFHPESILTSFGPVILQQAIECLTGEL